MHRNKHRISGSPCLLYMYITDDLRMYVECLFVFCQVLFRFKYLKSYYMKYNVVKTSNKSASTNNLNRVRFIA